MVRRSTFKSPDDAIIAYNFWVMKRKFSIGRTFQFELSPIKSTGKSTLFCFVFIVGGFIPAFSQSAFPENFVGDWKGIMKWYSPMRAEPQEVPMELHVHPLADSAGFYSWLLFYGEANGDQRHYTLKPIQPERGHWVIDEHNGILLDNYWIGGVFSAVFSIENSAVWSNFRLEGEEIIVEFFGYKILPERSSGGQSQQVPKVDSYRIGSYQRAVLRRME